MSIFNNVLYEHTIYIYNCIALNRFDLLKEGCLSAFSRKDIEDTLNEYGGKLTVIDKDHYKGRFDSYHYQKNCYETEIDMIVDNTISDLTMICRFIVEDSGIISEEIIDIHVL